MVDLARRAWRHKCIKTIAMEPLIPGQRDESTLTHRQPGSIGGDPHGADVPAAPPEWEDEQTKREYQRDGGGAERERKDGR
jgi:hypothetical protein